MLKTALIITENVKENTMTIKRMNLGDLSRVKTIQVSTQRNMDRIRKIIDNHDTFIDNDRYSIVDENGILQKVEIMQYFVMSRS